MSIVLTSQAFEANQEIPRKYTGDGENISPPLSWSDIPEETRELALICDDPDAPTAQPFVHWVIYKIPADVSYLPEGIPCDQKLIEPWGALQGQTSFGSIGYGGPAPPRGHGTHHYHFKLYALDSELPVEGGISKNDLLQAMEEHVLTQTELVGTYER